MKRFLSLLLLASSLGFAQDPCSDDPKIVPLQGKIKKGVYYAPDNLFCFNVPPLHNGGYVEDVYVRDKNQELTQGGVRFEDDVGTLIRVEFDLIPPHLIEKMCNQRFSDIIIQQTFNVGIMTIIRQAFPNAEILHEELINLTPDKHAIFSVVLIPNGGTLVHPDCDERMNAARSYLIMETNGYIIYLSEQDLQFVNEKGDACQTYKDRLKRLLGEMIYYYNNLSWCNS